MKTYFCAFRLTIVAIAAAIPLSGIKTKGSAMNETNANRTEVIEVTAVKGRKGSWKIDMSGDRITFTSSDAEETISFQRPEADEVIELGKFLSNRFLLVKLPKDKITFQLDQQKSDQIRAFFTPPTLNGLKASLKSKFRGLLPVGILITLTSLPIPADPESGAVALPMDTAGLALGLSLVVIAVVRKWYPNRNMFLVDGIWCLALAADVLVDVLKGANPWWLILTVLMIFAAKGRFGEYRRFSEIATIHDTRIKDHRAGQPIEPGDSV